MSQDTITAIETSIKESRKYIDLGTALERLGNNKDFKQLVKQGYFSDEAVRLVHLKADPEMQTPVRQAAILSQIDAIGALSGYFREIARQAEMARKSIEISEAVLAEEMSEELDQ